MAGKAAEPDDALLSPLYSCPEVFVYRVPATSVGAEGHKASGWGALDSPLVVAQMRMLGGDEDVVIQLWDGRPGSTTAKLVTVCRIRVGRDLDKPDSKIMPFWVDQVIDSSRYFALRNPHTGRFALVGIGFRDRQPAFDFKAALAEHERFVYRQRALESGKPEQSDNAGPEEGDASEDAPASELSSLSLGSGEKIHINMGGGSGRKAKTAPEPSPEDDNALFALPPPAAPKTTSVASFADFPSIAPPPAAAAAAATAGTTTSSTFADDDEEWESFHR